MGTVRNDGKTKRLAIDTVLFGISTFGSKILVFLLTPLYTATLLTEEFGIADLINTTVNLIYPILTLAIADATLTYALDKAVSKKAVLGNSLLLTFLSVFVLMAFYPLTNLVNSEVVEQIRTYWVYFVITYAGFNIHNCLANFIKGIGHTKLFAVQGIIHTLTIIVCNIYFLLVLKNGLTGYLLSIIIGFFVPIVIMFFAGRVYRYLFPFELEKKLFVDMIKYSIPMVPTILAWAINTYIDKYMVIGIIGGVEGLSASGIYSVAHKIPSLLTAVLSVFVQAWQISAISNVNDDDESEYYTNVYGAMNIVSLIGCMVIVPLSKVISGILFDPAYFTAWQYIPMLTVAALFSSICGFLAAAFRAYKKTKLLFVSVTFGAVVNIILNALLIGTLGVIGAAIATAASFIVTWVIRMITIQKIVKLKIPVVTSAVTYILFIAVCLLISFDVSGAYWYYVVACIIIIALNFKEIKKLIQLGWTFVRRFIKPSNNVAGGQ